MKTIIDEMFLIDKSILKILTKMFSENYHSESMYIYIYILIDIYIIIFNINIHMYIYINMVLCINI